VEKYGTAGQATDDNIIQRMRFACWITKATDTHSEYVILIAFPRQQWLSGSCTMLRLQIHCLSYYLWGHSKVFVCAEKIPSAAHLWQLVFDARNTITSDTILRVIVSWIPRLHLCIRHNGGHMEHVL
jgi:hypothetical protein